MVLARVGEYFAEPWRVRGPTLAGTIATRG